MFSRKKSYSEKLKSGIPKVIFYSHKPLGEISVEFHRHIEAVTYDQRDILDEKGRVEKSEKIDTSKTYESIFEL